MRRLVNVLAAVFAFVIGITAASLTYFLVGNWVTSEPSIQISPLIAPKQERTYRRGVAGESTGGSFITLNSSDGMNFTKWSVDCLSTEGAKRELEKRIKGANKIISREPVVDSGGQQIGEKIVALFSSEGIKNAAYLLWTEKEELFQVESSSLRNILEYRKDFKR